MEVVDLCQVDFLLLLLGFPLLAVCWEFWQGRWSQQSGEGGDDLMPAEKDKAVGGHPPKLRDPSVPEFRMREEAADRCG